MSTILQVENLVKKFDRFTAVDGISFEIQKGQVAGFIGANGAGKTTTMRIIATLETATSGKAKVNGFDVNDHPLKVRQQIGWMPDDYGVYDSTTVLEYMDFFARAFGITGSKRKARIDEVMEFSELTPLSDKMITDLSKGQKQRLCFGRMLLNDPAIMILDEPAAGLDPKARVEFKRLVRLLKEQQKTLFISSHILSELEEMCDTLLFINNGKLIHHGSSGDLRKLSSQRLRYKLILAAPSPKLDDWITLHDEVTLVEKMPSGAVVDFNFEEHERITAVLKSLIDAGVPLTEFYEVKQALEDAFIDIIRSKEQKA